MYESSGTIGPGINVGRASRLTGAAAAAVTSAKAVATNLSENCILAFERDVVGKQGESLPGGESRRSSHFYIRTNA